jgi:hypothetical protein
MVPFETVPKRFDTLNMYIAGSKENCYYQYILIIVERLSRYIFTSPHVEMPNEILILQIVYHTLGQNVKDVKNIVTDQGARLISKAWRETLLSNGIKPKTAILYHLQTDG